MLTTLAALVSIKAAGFCLGFAVALPYVTWKAVRIARNPWL
jgi:hypothetical protein